MNFLIALFIIPSVISYFTSRIHVCKQNYVKLYSGTNINSNIDESLENKIQNDKELQEYLSGKGAKEWKGSKSMLKRRGEMPDPTYKPIDVLRVCLKALESNDYPQLDHGACVVLEFKAPNSPLAVFLNPAHFGSYLRNSEYKSILDFKNAKPSGNLIILKEEQGQPISIKQDVEITTFPDYNSIKSVFPADSNAARIPDHKVIFSFFMSLHDDLWLIDAIQKDSS